MQASCSCLACSTFQRARIALKVLATCRALPFLVFCVRSKAQQEIQPCFGDNQSYVQCTAYLSMQRPRPTMP